MAIERECPEALAHVWDWYCSLSAARQGSDPISFSEIAAFSRLTRSHVTPFEVGCLRRLDRAHMKAFERKAGKPQISGKNVAAASDVAGVKGLMRGLAAKRKPSPKERETT